MNKTSAIVASLAEAHQAIAEGLSYPVLAIPFGAEQYELPCRILKHTVDLTEETFDELFASAFPLRGIPHVHLISKAGDKFWMSYPADVFTLSAS